MKVFSLNEQEGAPRYGQMLQTNYGFWLRGYEVVPFERAQLSQGEFDEYLLNQPDEVIFVASVGVMREAFRRAGKPIEQLLDFPAELEGFFGREISQCSMGEVREWEKNDSGRFPIHIKPSKNQKLFTGTVVDTSADFVRLCNVSDEEPLYVQDYVEIQSEWRATILRGKLVNAAHYKGDPLAFPDRAIMESAIAAYRSAPVGYAMDWGVTSTGKTILVEVNDGFALGNYGVKSYLYTALLESRWREIMGLPDNYVGI